MPAKQIELEQGMGAKKQSLGSESGRGEEKCKSEAANGGLRLGACRINSFNSRQSATTHKTSGSI